MCEKELVVIEKQEVISFIKNIIDSAYKLGTVSGNMAAKEDLKNSIDNLPLVSKENIKNA